MTESAHPAVTKATLNVTAPLDTAAYALAVPKADIVLDRILQIIIQ